MVHNTLILIVTNSGDLYVFGHSDRRVSKSGESFWHNRPLSTFIKCLSNEHVHVLSCGITTTSSVSTWKSTMIRMDCENCQKLNGGRILCKVPIPGMFFR